MKIKTGDKVKVLSGKDRGKTGKIIQVLFDKKKNQHFVVVEGLNLRKKHLRASKGESGRVIELSAPIQVSKVMIIDPKSNKPTRISITKEGDTKKRVAKRSGEFLD